MAIHVERHDDSKDKFEDGTLEDVFVTSEGKLELTFGGKLYSANDEALYDTNDEQLFASDRSE